MDGPGHLDSLTRHSHSSCMDASHDTTHVRSRDPEPYNATTSQDDLLPIYQQEARCIWTSIARNRKIVAQSMAGSRPYPSPSQILITSLPETPKTPYSHFRAQFLLFRFRCAHNQLLLSPPLSQIASKPQKLVPLPHWTPTTTPSTLTSSSSLTDPIWSPLPVITDDMFEAFHKYINTKLQP